MNQQDSFPSSSHLADVLGDLIERLRDRHITLGGPIEAEMIEATNVVSGLQIVIHQPASPTSSSLLWTITSRRNPYFIGREDLLTTIANALQTSKGAAPPQALSGLGGIGKTQIALEYAYRFVANYQFVFWARAATRDTLIADYVTFATLLSLPEKDEQDQLKIVAVIKLWLTTHDKWLLILDNADDLVIVRNFLPSSPTGHILLTTRAEVTAPLAQRIEVNTLPIDTAALFLLQRAGVLALGQPLDQASLADQALARHLCTQLGGLALALDQAGAYILEEGLSLSSYLQNYEVSQAQLLNNRGGDLVDDHPDSVTKTLFLSFQLVQQRSPIAADLLRFCAFLAPDAIPEELFTQNPAKSDSLLLLMKNDPQQFSTALKALRAYSLVRRNPNNLTLSIHRLVQAVLQDTLEEAERHTWAERVILAVDAAFPHPEHTTWSQCERLLPHALFAAQYIETEQVSCYEAGGLLDEMASYLQDRARYAEAEPLYQQALLVFERLLGPEDHIVAFPLKHLASLYHKQGKYAEAEPLYQRALLIWEQWWGPEHGSVAALLQSLANLYCQQGKYAEAEPLYQRALRIRMQQWGPEDGGVADSLTGLANLYREQGKYAEAKPLYHWALRIWEQQVEPGHPVVVSSLTGLANLYREQGTYAEAEPLYQRALRIREQQLGPEHPETAEIIHDLARFWEAQNNGEEASIWYTRALAIREQALGAHHPKTTETRTRFIALLHAMERHEEAAQLESVLSEP